MTILLYILFFILFTVLLFLIVSRKPARLPGFEKTMNQSLDQLIFLILTSFIFVIFSFKCR